MNKIVLIVCGILTLVALVSIYQTRSKELPETPQAEQLSSSSEPETVKPEADQLQLDQSKPYQSKQQHPAVSAFAPAQTDKTSNKKPTQELAHTNSNETSAYEEDISQLLSFFDEPFSLNDSSITGINVFLSRLPEDLSENDLQAIIKQINAQRPDAFDPDPGQIIYRLYNLRSAETQLLNSASPPASPEQLNILNQRLETLRSNILGPHLKPYFYPADLKTLSTIETDKPASLIDKLSLEGLSDQEIDAHIAEKFGEQSAYDLSQLRNVENLWLERYLKFSAEKQVILDAGLADEDKAEQITELLKRHYSEQELSGAIAFDKLLSEPAASQSEQITDPQ